MRLKRKRLFDERCNVKKALDFAADYYNAF